MEVEPVAGGAVAGGGGGGDDRKRPALPDGEQGGAASTRQKLVEGPLYKAGLEARRETIKLVNDFKDLIPTVVGDGIKEMVAFYDHCMSLGPNDAWIAHHELLSAVDDVVSALILVSESGDDEKNRRTELRKRAISLKKSATRPTGSIQKKSMPALEHLLRVSDVDGDEQAGLFALDPCLSQVTSLIKITSTSPPCIDFRCKFCNFKYEITTQRAHIKLVMAPLFLAVRNHVFNESGRPTQCPQAISSNHFTETQWRNLWSDFGEDSVGGRIFDRAGQEYKTTAMTLFNQFFVARLTMGRIELVKDGGLQYSFAKAITDKDKVVEDTLGKMQMQIGNAKTKQKLGIDGESMTNTVREFGRYQGSAITFRKAPSVKSTDKEVSDMMNAKIEHSIDKLSLRIKELQEGKPFKPNSSS